ncbi:MAG: DUF2264 domain-containing protein [Hormoscilla sp.]
MKTIQWTTSFDYETSPITGWTRNHWEETVFVLLKGIIACASAGKARIPITGPRGCQGPVVDELEGFARSFIMAGVWLHASDTGSMTVSGETLDVAEFYREGILAGTNPTHPEYWGKIVNYSQHIVECASLAWSLYLSQAHIWDKYSVAEKKQVADYLRQCDRAKCYKNNWLLFKVVINAVLQKLSMPFSTKEIDANLRACQAMYLGDGWYRDGKINQIDYYNAWAFHYYFSIWAILDGDRLPEIAQIHIERMQAWMRNFRYFFSGEGSIPCFGRSATYRFAYLGPIALGLYLNCHELELGEIKTICNATLKFFFDREILTDKDLLSPGYLRHAPRLLEYYSCAGSPYWAAKAFNLLLLPASHPFWQVPEKPLAIDSESVSIPLKSAGFLLLADRPTGHVQLINQKSHYWDPNFSSKYTNFVYSSVFSYDIGPLKKKYEGDGALCDNALTFSDGGKYVQRSQIQNLYCERNFAAAKYPLRIVKREATRFLPRLYGTLGWAYTYILVKDDFTLNVHRIQTRKSLRFKEGGYPLGFDEGVAEILSTEGAEAASIDGKISFIRNLYGYDRQFAARPLAANVPENNIRYKYSVVPALGFENKQRNLFYLASMVYGKIGDATLEQLMQLVTDFRIENGLVRVTFYDGERAVMQLGKIAHLDLILNGKRITGKLVMARVDADGKNFQMVKQ